MYCKSICALKFVFIEPLTTTSDIIRQTGKSSSQATAASYTMSDSIFFFSPHINLRISFLIATKNPRHLFTWPFHKKTVLKSLSLLVAYMVLKFSKPNSDTSEKGTVFFWRQLSKVVSVTLHKKTKKFLKNVHLCWHIFCQSSFQNWIFEHYCSVLCSVVKGMLYSYM